jgi:hypothetical protein
VSIPQSLPAAVHHIALLLKAMTGYSRWIDPIACTPCFTPVELTPPAASLSFGAVSLAPGVFRGLCCDGC